MSDEVARQRGATARERAQRIMGIRRMSESDYVEAAEYEILDAERAAFKAGYDAARDTHPKGNGDRQRDEALEAWLRSRGEG